MTTTDHTNAPTEAAAQPPTPRSNRPSRSGKTSAMIASIRRPRAEDRPRTVRARPGQGWPSRTRRSSGCPRTWPSTPTCTSSGTASRSGSSRWAWPSSCCSAPPPGWPRPGWSRSRRPTRCSPPAAPTTSSAWTSPNPNLNVNVVGGLPGLTTGYGPSHQATEDIAIFRGMPNLTIVDPCDSVDIEQAVPQLAAAEGPTYLRLLRGNVPTVLDEYDYTFELGKAKVLRGGNDVVFISSGLMTMRALPPRRPWKRTTSTSRSCTPPPSNRSTPTTVLARAEHRPARRHPGKPHRHRRPVRNRRLRSGSRRGRTSRSCPSRCPTSSSTPAPCPPCTTGTGSTSTASSPRCSPD